MVSFTRKATAREIDDQLVDTILRLRRAKVAIRQIERELRVCRKTIRAIDRGQHLTHRIGPQVGRCPKCGGKQTLPCLVCAARQIRPSAA